MNRRDGSESEARPEEERHGARRSAWTAAHDGGRPERGSACEHAATVPAAPDRPADACAECRASGGTWRRLRWCATCGHVGCCDSSPGRHAYAHHESTGHPVVLSLAADEDWAWCFEDEVFLVLETGPPEPGARPGAERRI
ncbi:UBP-type zinc finger domain-containing protein [Streptomyces sp. NPDC055912]|uniref:UBP-type zinc finger domain-containing protein n=1 Tax=Streptomyces sp. NPDC055912 TaxID=3345660 RepID=UPI0035DC83F2